MDRDWNQAVWQLVSMVPEGRVATYGQIAALLGQPRKARHVGAALQHSPDEMDLPWHRIINSRGESSLPDGSPNHQIQLALLRSEGVHIHKARINLKRFQWQP